MNGAEEFDQILYALTNYTLNSVSHPRIIEAPNECLSLGNRALLSKF